MNVSNISKKLAEENKVSTTKSFIFAWGNDEFGQLGLGQNSYNPFYSTPRYTKYSINIKKIACGKNHSVMKSEQGAVYVFGSNRFGQLGIPPVQSLRTPSLLKFSKWISCWKVATGAYHTLIYTCGIFVILIVLIIWAWHMGSVDEYLVLKYASDKLYW